MIAPPTLFFRPDILLRGEVDTVLAGRTPSFADLPALSYTRMVIQEAMRLRRASWWVPRTAVADDLIDGYAIWHHRDARPVAGGLPFATAGSSTDQSTRSTTSCMMAASDRSNGINGDSIVPVRELQPAARCCFRQATGIWSRSG
jgi:Cytochrome P450